MVEKSQDTKKNHSEGTACDGTLEGREVYKIKGVFRSRRGAAWDRERRQEGELERPKKRVR